MKKIDKREILNMETYTVVVTVLPEGKEEKQEFSFKTFADSIEDVVFDLQNDLDV